MNSNVIVQIELLTADRRVVTSSISGRWERLSTLVDKLVQSGKTYRLTFKG